MERAAMVAGLGLKAHPHMLRHACGFALANSGHDTRAIQAYLGHSNIQHTVRYTELAPDRFKHWAKRKSPVMQGSFYAYAYITLDRFQPRVFDRDPRALGGRGDLEAPGIWSLGHPLPAFCIRQLTEALCITAGTKHRASQKGALPEIKTFAPAS